MAPAAVAALLSALLFLFLLAAFFSVIDGHRFHLLFVVLWEHWTAAPTFLKPTLVHFEPRKLYFKDNLLLPLATPQDWPPCQLWRTAWVLIALPIEWHRCSIINHRIPSVMFVLCSPLPIPQIADGPLRMTVEHHSCCCCCCLAVAFSRQAKPLSAQSVSSLS